MGRCRVVSRRRPAFQDRGEAGKLLGGELADLVKENVVVVGIPRGGVVIAKEVACVLDAGLDFILAHKLGAPKDPEYAIGAVAEGGLSYLDQRLARVIPPDFLEAEKKKQNRLIVRRLALYRKVLPRLSLRGRVVILVDDGAAMGYTMLVAIRAIRRQRPQKLLVALPVAPEKTIEWLSREADELLGFFAPYVFYGVGQFYESFKPVTELEVIRVLQSEKVRRKKSEHPEEVRQCS